MQKELTKKLKQTFRPEFVNRLDSVIVFRSLNREDIQAIVNIELEKVSARLVDHEISLTITPEAAKVIADLGYNPEMGARPLKRVIQQKVEDPLSDALLSGRFKAGDTVVVDVEILEDETDIVLRSEDEAITPESEKELIAAA